MLTTVRNGAAYVADAIASVRAQTLDDWEHVIVDDASDDRTVDVIERAARSDARVQLIRRTERGYPFVAANDGLRHARGRYIARLDADDVATPDRLACQLSFMRSNPTLRACVGRAVLMRPTKRFGPRLPVGADPRIVRWWLFVKRNLPHSAAFVERSAFEEIGGYRTGRVAQDFAMWCELAGRDWLAAHGDIVIRVRRHADQVSRTLTEPQREAGLAILAEHVAKISGEAWSPQETSLLYELQKRGAKPLGPSLRVLSRWQRLWEADSELGPLERRLLARLGRFLRIRVLALRAPVTTVMRRRS